MTEKTDRGKLRAENPTTWIPVESGDSIKGKVVDIAAAWSDTQYDGKDPDSGFYPLLRLEVKQADGYNPGYVLAVHCFAAVLQSRVLDNEPAPGETVIITYEGTGEKKQRGKNPPELYRLELPERDPAAQAARVYGKLAGKRRGLSPGANGPVPEPDIPVETAGLEA